MMIKKVKANLIQYKVLLENFSFLSVLQVSNLLIFLLMTPYIFRVLGKENYGLVVFAQTISTYFSILINFGFNVTATKDISINRDSKDKTSDIISTVLTLKGILFIVSFLILSGLVLIIPFLKNNSTVFFISMLYCLSETLFPLWYFQGTEKMKYIAIINIITRIASAVLIFVFVRNSDDFLLVPILLGSGSLSGAIIGLWILFWKHNQKFRYPSFSNLRLSIKENIPMFISSVSTQIYVNANKLIAGSFLGMQELAIYDVVDKIVYMLKIPVVLVGQTLFPRVSRDKDIKFVMRSMKLVLIFFVVIYTSVFIFANPLIQFFSGSVNPEAVNLLRLLSVSLLPICLGLFFAELLLIPFGKLLDYTRMRTISLFIYLIIIVVLFQFNQIGLFQLAITIITVETFVLFYSYFLCKKNKIL